MKTYSCFIILFVSLTGCTSQSLYNYGRDYQIKQCYELRQQDWNDCLAKAEMSYREYDQQRKDALEDKN
ncbi:hypothetical protein [Pleionea sp. CnH1-48]|uniref:hypothetical protein n=1 Tax=Pleionea sp. CnH1-48 TaxID=2954494 RepID=UPI002096D285|nr:hypothetical protein [Pleionea sp. CnH1-48]MCO7227466.1 hypothetical protein [Pleionea sp. CnH1-48]